jgi:hypothetical protein
MRTLDELIDALEEMREEVGGDAKVLVATQPNYPLSSRLGAVTAITDRTEGTVVYLAASETGTEYAPRAGWDGGVVYDEEEVG